MHAKLYATETQVVILATASLAAFAVSLLLGFMSNRPEFWWIVKLSTGIAAGCAVLLVVLNIVMHG